MCKHIMADDAEERRKRLARKAALAALLLFSPWKRLRPQIAVASHDIETYFDAVDTAMDTGTLTEALRSGSGVVPALTKLVRAGMLYGYQDGGSMVGKVPGGAYADKAFHAAQARAAEVSLQMHVTSKEWLKADPHNGFALSADRAERAARFEAAKAYYTGLQQAVWGHGILKEWIPLGDAPCEEICTENEDAGLIPVEEPFPSGDFAPLGHPSCECILRLARGTV